MNKAHFARWRANFFTGLAIVLPAVISLGVIIWLFFTVSRITDTLLIFLPQKLTHEDTLAGRGTGPMLWYWKLVALVVAIILISVVGLIARNYLGRKLIELVDTWILRIPLLNKIYGATKQVNEALTSGNKTAFKTVVMIEYPRKGLHSVGFLTGEVHEEIQRRFPEKMVSVFIPTTPNPTAGFLVMLPDSEVIRLDMSVTDGLKFIVSLGAIVTESPQLPRPHPGVHDA